MPKVEAPGHPGHPPPLNDAVVKVVVAVAVAVAVVVMTMIITILITITDDRYLRF